MRRSAMLSARGDITIGPARVRSAIALERDLRLFAIERRGLVYDSRFVGKGEVAQAECDVVIFLLEGALEAFDGPRVRAPAVLVTDDAWYETRGQFRATGHPYRAVEARIRRRAANDRTTSPRALPLVGALGRAASAHASAALDSANASLTESAHTLVAAMTDAGLVAPPRQSMRALDAGAATMWNAIANAYGRGDLLPSLKWLAATSALSLRQTSRRVEALQSGLLLPGTRWRDALLGLRLKAASLFLSCPELHVGEIARALGYGRLEAMTNAFQRAGLPSPTRVRAALLEPRAA
jgi:AraC-like DNA-binding protein